MHELSLIEALIEELEKQNELNKWGKVLKVNLKVGAMRQVIPEVMTFAFEVSTEGTFLDGAKLELDIVPIKWRCKACGNEWDEERATNGGLCEKCGSIDVELLSGMELEIESLEVEDTDVTES
ncbi:hydrogenase maturation nickel metallochaperone HypA [Thermovirga sp.]|uniref:Hydrogenase maturation factor HypA n=1 Tax=Thermococcus litoralis TaxID=2265 RepID=A0A7C5JVT6_THELI|nr:hydrogenase maturation nickel metallochaperone HypA [Thermovirga sp.]MBO8153295.1 hydrogenase maturation nickel metallochaperone HypA [Thermovirga sp.]MCD6183619.1 hydrogenase maturation nickel metallochaperone HypA [Thermovirga sp.]HHI00042.1 hydrogenase maturation nickel metallochaperone HypA [Thermococcus litoralis]